METSAAMPKHTFLTVLPDRIVYVDVPPHDPSTPFAGWNEVCRLAVLDQRLLSEEEAKDAVFHPAVRPNAPKAYFR